MNAEPEMRAAVHTVTHILTVVVPLLYIVRGRGQRVLRGYPVIVAMVVTMALCAAGWTLAALDGFTASAIKSAVATSVPLLQVLLLLAALRVFMSKVGRDPRSLYFIQHTRDEPSDVLLHSFVFFVLALGGIAVTATLTAR